jgi:hypothetical protein
VVNSFVEAVKVVAGEFLVNYDFKIINLHCAENQSATSNHPAHDDGALVVNGLVKVAKAISAGNIEHFCEEIAKVQDVKEPGENYRETENSVNLYELTPHEYTSAPPSLDYHDYEVI